MAALDDSLPGSLWQPGQVTGFSWLSQRKTQLRLFTWWSLHRKGYSTHLVECKHLALHKSSYKHINYIYSLLCLHWSSQLTFPHFITLYKVLHRATLKTFYRVHISSYTLLSKLIFLHFKYCFGWCASLIVLYKKFYLCFK